MPWRFVLVGRRSKSRPVIGPPPWGRGQCGWHGRWVSARQKQPDTDCKGWRESDRRRGGERRQARGFHDARFGPSCTCLMLCVCVCESPWRCSASNSYGCGVSSGRNFPFAASSACPCSLSKSVCVCVCWPSRRQGVVQLYYHPPTLPPLSLRPCVRVRTMWGVKWRGRESERRFGRGVKQRRNEHWMNGIVCMAMLVLRPSLSHASWRRLNARHLCSQRRSRSDPTAISVCIVPCESTADSEFYCSAILFFCIFLVLCIMFIPLTLCTAITQCVCFHKALIWRERVQIFVFKVSLWHSP